MNNRPILIIAVAAALSLATVSMASIWLKQKAVKTVQSTKVLGIFLVRQSYQIANTSSALKATRLTNSKLREDMRGFRVLLTHFKERRLLKVA